MKKTIHIVNGEYYAGAERVQDHLAACLPGFGWEVHFVCLKPVLFPQMSTSAAETIHVLPMRSRFDIRPVLALASMIRKGGYHIVHTHTPRSILVGAMAARLAGRPLVHHLHSPAAEDTEQTGKNRINALVERFCLRQVRRLIAVSERTRQWYEGMVPPGRMRVVLNGVPGPETLPERDPPGLEAPSKPPVIGAVALFRPRKGLEKLLEALAELKLSGLPAHLLAVGTFVSDEYRESVLAHAASLGVSEDVTWAGFTNDVPSMLARMDCLCLPSLFGEGLPMVVLEAMAWGVPVVASDVEGVGEAVRNGQDGLLVPPADAPALAGALRALLTDGDFWTRARESARKRQQEEFSDVAMARHTAEVYAEVMEE
ncbi:MAG: glycosyltransferase [Desulfovibrionaceae bacterium]